jgi:S1-C subfamily serine protease
MRATLAVALVLALSSSAPAAERPQPPETFAPVVDAVKAAVLSVVPAREPDRDEFDPDALLGGVADSLAPLRVRTLGVAVLVDPSGVALTGARIVRGVTDVAVVNIQGRRARATVIGADARTDIALLRVHGAGPFPVVAFGDSDEVRVGDGCSPSARRMDSRRASAPGS